LTFFPNFNPKQKKGGGMNVTRRDFFKITGASAAGAAIMGLGLDLKPFKSHAQTLKLRFAKETTSICCYCAVGCGLICSTGEAGAEKSSILRETLITRSMRGLSVPRGQR